MTNQNTLEAARYGNLALVASNFHIQTGNPAELDAVFVYARTAAHIANRTLTPARQAQGFKSQAHLDAFYASCDHSKQCPVCSRVGGYMPIDDGMQPYMDSCETGRKLTAESFKF